MVILPPHSTTTGSPLKGSIHRFAKISTHLKPPPTTTAKKKATWEEVCNKVLGVEWPQTPSLSASSHYQSYCLLKNNNNTTSSIHSVYRVAFSCVSTVAEAGRLASFTGPILWTPPSLLGPLTQQLSSFLFKRLLVSLRSQSIRSREKRKLKEARSDDLWAELGIKVCTGRAELAQPPIELLSL